MCSKTALVRAGCASAGSVDVAKLDSIAACSVGMVDEYDAKSAGGDASMSARMAAATFPLPLAGNCEMERLCTPSFNPRRGFLRLKCAGPLSRDRPDTVRFSCSTYKCPRMTAGVAAVISVADAIALCPFTAY